MRNLLTRLAIQYKMHLSIAVLVIAVGGFAFGFWFRGAAPPPKCGPTDNDLAVCTATILHRLGAPKAQLIQCLAIDTPGEYRCVVTPQGTNDAGCYSLVVKRGERGFPVPVKLEAAGIC